MKFVRKSKLKSIVVESPIYVGEDAIFFEKLKEIHPTLSRCSIQDLIVTLKKTGCNFVVFDGSFVSNKQVIEAMMLLNSQKISFKIKPTGTNFIIGSSSAKEKGEIISFEDC